MAPYGHTSTVLRETIFHSYPTLSWTIKPIKTRITVPNKYVEETYFAPKGSLDRLLRDSRFLSLLKTLKKVPRIMSWIEVACTGGCRVCRNVYHEHRRMAIPLCGHTMCDACLQRIMGNKMKSVYCPSCLREIFVVLILDRPKDHCNLANVRHFLLQDDTPVHDPTLPLGSLVSLWRLGKEYPVTMTPCSVEPVPALYATKRPSKVKGPVESELKFVGHAMDHEEETYARKTQALIESVLSHLGTDEDPFLTPSTLKEGDLIDWNRVFDEEEDEEPNAIAHLASSRPYNRTQVFGGDVRMNSNFLNFETSDFGKRCHNVFAEKRESEICYSEVQSDVTLNGDCEMDKHSGVSKTLNLFDNLIAQLPRNYKQLESSNYLRSTFITEGKILRRRLECPQWIMRVQVVPVVFDSKVDDLIRLD